MRVQCGSLIAANLLEAALRLKLVKFHRIDKVTLESECNSDLLLKIAQENGITCLIENEKPKISQFKDLIPESPWGVICAVHGEQGLSDRERFNQVKMGAGCPIRGCHGRARIDGKRLDRAILKASALFLQKGEVQPMLDLNINTVKELGDQLACIVKGWTDL